jgi:hypothetical protein
MNEPIMEQHSCNQVLCIQGKEQKHVPSAADGCNEQQSIRITG